MSNDLDDMIIDDVVEEPSGESMFEPKDEVKETKPKTNKKQKTNKKSQNSSNVVAQSVHVILHSAPDVYARKITRLNAGNQLVVLEDLDGWLKVSFKKFGEELIGFVRTSQVRWI